MKIPEDWKLLRKISHQDIKPFVIECLRVKGIYKTLYLVISMVSITFLAALITFSSIRFFKYGESSSILQFLSAFLFSVTMLIIIHELLHAVAYKLKGANHIYFGGNLRKFMFYAASDGAIINGKAFRFVALAPFTVVFISSLTLAVSIPHYKIFFFTMLALHNLFCGGDFAMLNFINKYPLKEVFTLDVKAQKESYFYLSKK